jgi:uncharacterized protein YuzE
MVSGKIVVTFDTDANAMYYKLEAGKATRTEKIKGKGLEYLLDYDNSGRLIGLEVLDMKKALELAAGHLSLLFIPEVQGLMTRLKH